MRGRRSDRRPSQSSMNRGNRASSRPHSTPRSVLRGHGGEESRAGRDRARWVVGLHSCGETLRVRPQAVRELWLRTDWASSQPLRELHDCASAKRVTIRERSQGQLDQVGSGHQGVALACNESPEVNWPQLESVETSIVLVLDGLEDPHNLGSILRTAWLVGVDAIFIPPDRAVGLTPAVCKVASGGAEHVPVDASDGLVAVLERLKKSGYWVYGLAEGGTGRPWDFKLPQKVAWVIGSEGAGIRKTIERVCDDLVRIPQVASGSSYNAAIACAMALAETSRQHGKPE